MIGISLSLPGGAALNKGVGRVWRFANGTLVRREGGGIWLRAA